MPRVLLIGNHEEFRQGLESSGALAGCQVVTAAGNVDTKTNVGNGAFSEAYSYDGLDRLTDTHRNGTDLQNWTLDALGNWASTTTCGTARTSMGVNFSPSFSVTICSTKTAGRGFLT